MAELPSENTYNILSTLNSKKRLQSVFKSSVMAAELPSEIMYDILSRMPVKSLARFRCVSKLWCNYINDPYLEAMHAKQAAVTSDPMLIVLHQVPSDDPNSPCTLSFLEYKEEARPGGCTLLEVRKTPPSMELMCKWENKKPRMIVLGSCNGLLYSSQRHSDGTRVFVVINPLRRECHELPPIKTLLPIGSGLVFDDSTNTFKMVCVMQRQQVKENQCTMVHVLGTDSWRKIPKVPSYPISSPGMFANGCLHWLTGYNIDLELQLIIGFDMKTEEFRLIKPPRKIIFDVPGVYYEYLVNLHGQLGFVYGKDRFVEVWVLKERGWVMHCEFEQKSPLFCGFVEVLGFWNENGDILVKDGMIDKLWFVYNLKTNSLCEVSVVGWEEGGAKDLLVYQSCLFSTRYSIENPRKKG